MATVRDKIAFVMAQVQAFGICSDEVDALEENLEDLEEAERELDIAKTERLGTGIAAGGGAIAVFLCIGPQAVGCLVVGGAGFLGSIWGNKAAHDSEDLARDKINDALNDLSKALDKLCSCLYQHIPSEDD